MKRIKQIIEALRVLSRTPSKAITMATAVVSTSAERFAKEQGWTEGNPEAERFAQSLELVETILAAVVTVAEDMEKTAEPVKPRE